MSDIEESIEEELEYDEYDPDFSQSFTEPINVVSKPIEKTGKQVTFGKNEESFDHSYGNDSFYSEKSSPAAQTKKLANSSAPTNPKGVLPSLGLQCLEAEVAIEELSKEVIRLRNQHRMVLKQRREAAESKKQRASERRSKYKEELEVLSNRIYSRDGTIALLQETIKNLEAEVKDTIFSRNSSEESYKRLESTVHSQAEQISQLKVVIAQKDSDFEELVKAQKSKELQWQEDKQLLVLDKEKVQITLSVLQSTMDASEKKLTQERLILPEYHQKRLDEELERLKLLQDKCFAEERKLKADHDARVAAFESSKQLFVAELDNSRKHMQSVIEEEKKQLELRQHEFEIMKNRTELALSAERKEIQAAEIKLELRESELKRRQLEIEKSKSELEASIRLVQPTLLNVEYERSLVEDMRSRAEAIMVAAEAQASQILAAEKELIGKRRVLSDLRADLEAYNNELEAKAHALSSQEMNMMTVKKSVEKEKFIVHRCMMELHEQVQVMKKTVGYYSKNRMINNQNVSPNISDNDFFENSNVLLSLESASRALQEKLSIFSSNTSADFAVAPATQSLTYLPAQRTSNPTALLLKEMEKSLREPHIQRKSSNELNDSFAMKLVLAEKNAIPLLEDSGIITIYEDLAQCNSGMSSIAAKYNN